MLNDDNKLLLIREVILKYLPASRIILFGSRARDKYDARSDYDVMAVAHENISELEKKALKPKIRRDLAEMLIPVDIILTTENEIKQKAVLTNHIINIALATGVSI